MIALTVLTVWLANVVAPAPLPVNGKAAYETRCASCHGEDLRGGVNAPSLRGVGAADLDFWMVTGRMPAAVPWVQVGHRGQQLAQSEIESIESYVTARAPGGPPIPLVTVGGDLRAGRVLFAQNCEHCHGVDANGASIGRNAWAPTLRPASITQVAEAVRVGPGNMPIFGERQLSASALDDVAGYVASLQADAATPEIPLSSSGPVPEGLFGWLTIGLLSSLAYVYSRYR